MVMLAIHLIGLVAVSVPNMPHGFDVAYCNAENSYQCGLQVGEQMKDSIQSKLLFFFPPLVLPYPLPSSSSLPVINTLHASCRLRGNSALNLRTSMFIGRCI